MSDVSNPARYGAVVVPSDATVFDQPTRSLYIGGAGNVAVRMWGNPTGPGQSGGNGGTVTYLAVPVGFVLPVQVDQVLATGTTATNVVRMW